jgi:hypothetical protein
LLIPNVHRKDQKDTQKYFFKYDKISAEPLAKTNFCEKKQIQISGTAAAEQQQQSSSSRAAAAEQQQQTDSREQSTQQHTVAVSPASRQPETEQRAAGREQQIMCDNIVFCAAHIFAHYFINVLEHKGLARTAMSEDSVTDAMNLEATLLNGDTTDANTTVGELER